MAMKRPKIIWLLMLGCFVLSVGILRANNIQVSNVSIASINTTDNYAMVQFDISWDNSWRTSSAPNNWDAAWVFIKYQDKSSGLWKHARLHENGHLVPAGAEVELGLRNTSMGYHQTDNPGVGVFLYRSSDGSGTFSLSEVKIRWNYGANGLSNVTKAFINGVKVFAIEMVYVPTGTYSLGSGCAQPDNFNSGSNSSFESGSFRVGGAGNTPYSVSSEGAINIGNSAGNLWGNSHNQSNPYVNATILGEGLSTATIPAAYPKGYQGFYAMKHELTIGAYAEFLNTLTRSQQSHLINVNTLIHTEGSITNGYVTSNTATYDGVTNQRNALRVMSPLPPSGEPAFFFCDMNGNGVPGDADDGADVAFFGLATRREAGLAYLDWAGLRVMTEMEFEKACKGPNNIACGFPWGTAAQDYSSSCTAGGANFGTANELPPAAANVALNGGTCYLYRVGSFARASTNRRNAGASYYGLLDMAGNLSELTVNVSFEEGRGYDGSKHSDGELGEPMLRTATFDSFVPLNNEDTWPVQSGLGRRGGFVQESIQRGRVGDRLNSSGSGAYSNPRGVRSVPVAN
jgi:formylglycine-generating enzyme required for sulfatase activity